MRATQENLQKVYAFSFALIVGCGAAHDLGGDVASDAAVDTVITIDTSTGSADSTVIVVGDASTDAMRMPFCGDNQPGAGEVCDDGNNVSGDGCRGDCLSNETCGNNVVDFARGEVCDGTMGCSVDCHSIAMCPNGAVDPGETCDDNNSGRFDGCGRDCTHEYGIQATQMALGGMDVGCDLNADGRIDNAFASAFGGSLALVNGFLMMGGGRQQPLLGLTGLRSLTASDVNVAWLQAGRANPQALEVLPASVDAMGNPVVSFDGRVQNSMLNVGPSTVTINLALFAGNLVRSQIQGTLVPQTLPRGPAYSLNRGLLCGGLTAPSLARVPLSVIPIGMTPPACDGQSSATLLDAIAGGGRIAIVALNATAMDVDGDRDGLERFEITTGNNCSPVITGCIDGDGTRIAGRACINDPRIADGFSMAFTFQGTPVTLGGVR